MCHTDLFATPSAAANIKAQGLGATYDSVDPDCGGWGGVPPERSADRWCRYPTAALDCCHGRTHTFHVRQRDEQVSLRLYS